MREQNPPNIAIRNLMSKVIKKWGCVASLAMTIILCFTFIACPPAAKKPAKKVPKAKQEEKKPAEVSRPAAAPQAETPQRKASDRLVEKGKASIDSKSYDQAAGLFQDAMNVDPSNGVAYYYLALTDHYLGQGGAAAGLLDKAESLLRGDKYWAQKIEELRTLVTGEKPQVAPLPPVIDQY